MGNSWALWSKNESSSGCCRRCHGCQTNGTASYASNDEGRWTNTTTFSCCAHSRSRTSYCVYVGSCSTTRTKANVGRALVPAHSKYVPELAGKITGMLLEIDNSELV